MNAKITYEMRRVPHPFDKKMRDNNIEAWCLFEVITPAAGPRIYGEPIAIFNLDSQAERFQGHVFAEDLDGKLVTIDRDYRALLERP